MLGLLRSVAVLQLGTTVATGGYDTDEGPPPPPRLQTRSCAAPFTVQTTPASGDILVKNPVKL
jgi:hypothetical protein